MLTGTRTRFISEAKVIETLTAKKSLKDLPALLNKGICKLLGLPEDIQLVKLTKVVTKSVGGTQCRPYIMHLSNGEKRFLKLTPKVNNSSSKQSEADNKIKESLDNTYPFVLMQNSIDASDEFARSEMLFFPFVAGDNLFIATQYTYKDSPGKLHEIFCAVGKALALVHIECMKKKGHYDQFLLGDGTLPAVLVHDDWQATNIMVTPDIDAIIIDTEGTAVSDKPYRNLVESWELCSSNPQAMESLISGYVKSFPVDTREKVKQKLMEHLIQKHGPNFTDTVKVKSIPNL